MNVFRIIIITCFVLTISSCTTIHYYDFEEAGKHFPINKGYIGYELYSIDPEIKFSKDINNKDLVLTNPYYKKNKEMLDYLREIEISKDNTYYLLTIFYDVNEKYGYIETIKQTPDVKILVDSIYVNFIDTSKSYILTEYFSKYFVFNRHGDPLTKAINVLPIKISLNNKEDFEISLKLTILNEDGSLLEKRNMNLNVERKKKVNTFLTPWP